MGAEPSESKTAFDHRLGPGTNKYQYLQQRHDEQEPKVCFHWRAGKCSRFVCPFLHGEHTTSDGGGGGGGPTLSKRPHSLVGAAAEGFSRRKSPNFNNTWSRVGGGSTSRGRGVSDAIRKKEKNCNYWVQGNCSYGDKCRFSHSWRVADRLSMLTTLEGHQKVVTGIALPSGSDKLYSGSKDDTVRVWDSQSGQCTEVIKLDGEVGCMFSAGPWVFVGLPNMVKAWNVQSAVDLSLSGPLGQVYALVVGKDLLFAGAQDGTIVAWKFYPASNCFEPAASLKGHGRAVVTLAVLVVANRLFSGSMDHTIRVWNLETLECVHTLTDHTDVVMSVLCWDQSLLSCSLDKSIKLWAATESGNLEVTYTHNEDKGLLALNGMHDSRGKLILFCSANDNSVRLYDLPSFMWRGKTCSKNKTRAIHIGPSGLFFTGEETGEVRVWKLLNEPTTAAS